MHPIELLRQELAKYEKAKKKSDEAYNEGKIDELTNIRHVKSLKQPIALYKLAIKLLTLYKDKL